jgi:membrane protein YdbS with pleckstrin-like domain
MSKPLALDVMSIYYIQLDTLVWLLFLIEGVVKHLMHRQKTKIRKLGIKKGVVIHTGGTRLFMKIFSR